MPDLTAEKPSRTRGLRRGGIQQNIAKRLQSITSLLDHGLQAQGQEKQAEVLKDQAYEMALRQGYEILHDLRAPGKKSWGELQQRSISWGIAADKILKGVESSGITLTLPAALLDKFMLAVQIKPLGDTNKSISNTTTLVVDQQVTPTKEG
jgi:hypothetical protein